jgi:hypothetical protein
VVVASILGPWRLLPSNAPRGALNMHLDRNVYKSRGRRHGVEGRRGCPGVQQRLLRSGKIIMIINMSSKKRSQETSSTTFWTFPTTYDDGFVHLLSCRSQKCSSGLLDFHTERKKKLFEKMGIRGGEGGSNEIPVSMGLFLSPPFPF